MRKTFFLAVAAMVFQFAGAQTTFGLKAGANFSNLKASGSGISMTFDSRTGLYAGALVNFAASESFSVQPEVVYSMEGADFNFSGQTASTKLSYLNIPVMAQFHTSGLVLETGPQLGLLMSAKDETGGTSSDSKDDYESINFSWGVGAGYRFLNGLGIGVRYNLGLSNIAKDSGDATVKSNVFQAGISFNFGGSSN